MTVSCQSRASHRLVPGLVGSPWRGAPAARLAYTEPTAYAEPVVALWPLPVRIATLVAASLAGWVPLLWALHLA